MPRDVIVNVWPSGFMLNSTDPSLQVSTNYTENVDPCDDKRPKNDSATELDIVVDSKTSRL